MKIGFPVSITVLLWSIAGFFRYIFEEKLSRAPTLSKSQLSQKIKKVAICLPAHNEEVVIRATIRSLKRLVSTSQIYVVSDGSSDSTGHLVKLEKCNLLKINTGVGKAKALKTLIAHYKLLETYEYILFVDADMVLYADYLEKALPILENDKKIAAIAGYAVSSLRDHMILSKNKFIVSYRYRLNRLLYNLLTYGQTWKLFNAAWVIPGSGSIYRTDVLEKLEIDTPRILIEDFNLAFQVHRKKLGRIAHYPAIGGIDQDPDNIRDYWQQVTRWNIGFFQTVRENGIWLSFFWLSLGFFTFEVLLNSIFIVLMPLIVLIFAAQFFLPYFYPQTSLASSFLSTFNITPLGIYLGVFVVDYILTVFVAIRYNRYILAIYGLGFYFMHFLTSLIFLINLPKGLILNSQGIWVPPTRR